MTRVRLSADIRIFDAAYGVFMLFGYHGTTLQQIALKAGVNKSAIHYYYRSKEKLYKNVIRIMTDLLLSTTVNFSSDRERLAEATWFLYTELYNNRILFEQTIMELYPDDYECKLKDLTIWLEFPKNSFSYTYRGFQSK